MGGPTEDLTGLGFRMPAEWEKHSATWLSWPHESNDWPGKFPAIPFVYCEIVKNLALNEVVKIVIPDVGSQEIVANLLSESGVNLSNVVFSPLPRTGPGSVIMALCT